MADTVDVTTPATRRVRACWDGDHPAPDGWVALGPPTADQLVRQGVPLETMSVDQVHVGPALARVDGWRLPALLEEVRRVLRPGGAIRVVVTDLERAVDAYRRGDGDFFWDHPSEDLAGALAVQLLDWGAARTLFTSDLLMELLTRAGFAEARPCPVGDSPTDPVLAAPDPLPDHACAVEATNPRPWPGAAMPDRPSSIHLSWGDPACATIGVTWTAPPGTRGRVRHRRRGDATWSDVSARSWPTVDGSVSPHVFHATCAGLQPSTPYEYEVVQHIGERDASSGVAEFSTLPDDPDTPISFAFFADTGVAGRPDGLSDGVDAVHDIIEGTDPDFVLGGGDYAYKSSDPRLETGQQAVQAWLEQFSTVGRRRPLVAQWGNHEVELGEHLRDWTVHFPTPGTDPDAPHWSFDAGSAHIVAFFAPTADLAPDDISWLWQDLDGARSRGASWLVVFQHQPVFSNGTSHPTDHRVAAALGRVLDHHRVDLHLSAHDQNYERTFPLEWRAGGHVATSEAITEYPRGAGTVFAKVSPGGKRSDIGGSFSTLPEIPVHPVARAHGDAHHVAVVTYTRSRLELRVTAATGTEPAGTVVDRVVLTGGVP